MNAAVAVALAVFAADASASEYAWPLDLPRVLTSSFAEYRVGRVHMGIDLRTGSIGKDVHAAADGYVSRIRCSPHGYGKAVYLQLRDGHSIVYAHLDDFAPALRAYVRRAQHDRKTYTVDLYPDAGELSVKRGEIVGKSGQTGIGVPHLHYEIRDKTGAPVNPRSLGITWPDTSVPVFRKALIVPLGPGRVNGDVVPHVIAVRRGTGGGFTTDPVEVVGPVAFGIDVVDFANGGGTRLGVHTLSLRHGSREIFRIEHDRVSYENDRDGIVTYHPFFLDQGRFLMLWRWPGNESELIAGNETDGAFELAESEGTDVVIVAEDFYGNAAILTIPLRNGTRHAGFQEVPAGARSPAKGTVTFDFYGQKLVASAVFPAAEATPPLARITAPGSDADAGMQMLQVSDSVFRSTYADAPDSFVLTVEHPRMDRTQRGFITLRRGEPAKAWNMAGLEVRPGPLSPYGKLFISVEEVVAAPGPTLRAAGPAYRIWPEAAPIDEPIQLSFPVASGADDPARVHIYRKGDKRWEFQGGTVRDGRLEISTRQLGTFMALEDTAPPAIRNIRPRAGTVLRDSRPVIRAVIEDVGSDVDAFSATWNGRWLLMAYDPERRLLTWERDEDLPAGKGTIAIRVSDAAGNVAVREVDVEIASAGR